MLYYSKNGPQLYARTIVVRSSYSDLFYAELAQEAINEWKKEAHWGDSYHE